MHHGVYSLVLPRARPRLAAEWAALIACGPTALLSHQTAAWLHGLVDDRPRGPVQLTVVGADRRRPAITITRVAALSAAERSRRGGLAVTTAARTALDLAPTTSHLALARVVDRVLRDTSATAIRALAQQHGGRPGAGRLLAMLDPTRPSADTWSRGERRLIALLRQAGVPLPEANVQLGRDGHIPDLLWRAQRVIVDYDSEDFHFGLGAFHADRARHNALVAAGYQVLHVTLEQLTERPMQVVAWIVAALTRAGM